MRKFIACLGTAVLLSFATAAYAIEDTYVSLVTWYANEESANTSSWINNTAGSGSLGATTSEVMYVAKESDASKTLPIELYRKMTPIDGGRFVCEFAFSCSNNIEGMTFSLLSGKTKAVSLKISNSILYYEGANGNTALTDLSYSSNLDEHVYHVRIVVDNDNSITESVEVNGKTLCADVPYLNSTNMIDGFDVRTGEEATGAFVLGYLRVYSGFETYETFRSPSVPDGVSAIGNVGIRKFNYRYWDRYSAEINAASSIGKAFAAVQGRVNVEFQLLLPTKQDNVNVMFNAGSDEVMNISADAESFYANDGAVYDYIENIWYHFKAELDLDKNLADVYINGKLRAENISISDFGYIDNINVSAGESTICVDDIMVYKMDVQPSDYVTAPSVKNNDEYLVGMQMCPLWTEGTHTGWGAIKSAPAREPLLGYYDEGNPEVSDWEIKQMLEHGVDFELICAYTCYSQTVENRDPIKDNVFRHGNALHNGFFNAKYSNQMKFAILWENNGYKYGTLEYDDFFNNLVPFWIEYYFKDDRYLKIDGRPFISIYQPQNFFDLFGKDIVDIKAGVQKFRDMCIDAGVGDPIIAMSPGFQYTNALMDLYSEGGIDFASKYNFGLDGIKTQQHHLNNYKRYNEGNSMGIIPVAVQGFDSTPWNGKGGFKASTADYEAQLKWIRDTYIPSLGENSIGKNLVIAATWDEFGEGTIINPTVTDGYGYLNAINKVFGTGDNGGLDRVPTANQKSRVNKLTVQENFNTRLIEPILPDISTQVVKQSWNFDNGTDGWVSCGDIAEIKNTDGKLQITPSGMEPQIILRDIGISAKDINYVKITMKPNSSSGDGCVYWTTSKSSNLDVDNKQYFSLMNGGEIYIPVGDDYMWSGRLNDLIILLGTDLTDTGEIIEIESIELLGSETIENSVNIDGILEQCKISDDMYSLFDLAKVFGADLQYFVTDDKYTVSYNGNTFILKCGEKIITDKYKSILLDKAPILVESLPYISRATAMQIYGGYINGADFKTDYVSTVNTSRKLVYEFDLSDTDNMEFKHAKDIQYSGDVLKITSTGNDPYIKLPAIEVSASSVKRIAIGLKSDTASMGELFFSQDNEFYAEKSIPFAVTEGEREYVINPLLNNEFTGTIARLRLDPIAVSGKIEIQYIRLLGEVETPEIKIEAVEENSITLTANENIEYSINKKEYQSSNEFTNLLNGKYIVTWRFKGANTILGSEIVTIGRGRGERAVDVWDGTANTSWYSNWSSSFTIDSAEKLAGFLQLVSEGKTFSQRKVNLTVDVDFNNIQLEVAGGNTLPFKGEFNGNGHILYNIKAVNNDDNDFGFIARNEGKILNLGIDGADFADNAGGCSGILTGRSTGIIDNCFVKNAVFKNNSDSLLRLGTITGRLNGGSITSTYANDISFVGNVPSYGFGGFLCTAENGSEVSDCYTANINTPLYDRTRAFGAFDNESMWQNCWFEGTETVKGTVLNSTAAQVLFMNECSDILDDSFADSPGLDYNSGNPVLVWEIDESMNDISAEISATTTEYTVLLHNNKNEFQTAYVVTAFYKDDVLIDIKISEKKIDGYATDKYSESLKANSGADNAKVFVFNDLDLVMPYCKPEEVTIN